MAYSLVTSYVGEALLSGFNWFDGVDPSHGFVSYQTRSNAQSMGLYSIDEDTGVVRLGVDHTDKYGPGQGRPSIRLESKESYNQGLFIADFLHMPPSKCGLWPAFWAYGGDWPNNGEVDIIEGVNTNTKNVMSAHTRFGCKQGPSISRFSGSQRNAECAVGSDNVGCGYDPPQGDDSSYGDGFNEVQGGVYAMQWDSEHISLWHFPRGRIPADIEEKKPRPEGWGLPQAVFGGADCAVDSYWRSMNLVININFCGDFGEGVWGKSDACNAYAPTCSEYVADHPEAFEDAYWDVRYIDAYQLSSVSSMVPTSARQTPTTSQHSSTASTSGPHASSASIASFVAHSDHATSTSQPLSAQANSSSTTTCLRTPSITTTQASVPTGPVTTSRIDGFSYMGCFEVDPSLAQFTKIDDSREMTPQRCAKRCSGRAFAGVFDTQCFCADELDKQKAARRACNRACPGDAGEVCGGTSPGRNATIASGRGACFTLSVYRDDSQASSSGTSTCSHASAQSTSHSVVPPSATLRLNTTSSIYSHRSESVAFPPATLRTNMTSTNITPSIPSHRFESATLQTDATSTIRCNATTLSTKYVTTSITSTRFVIVSPVPVTRPLEVTASTVLVTEHCGCAADTSVTRTKTITMTLRGNGTMLKPAPASLTTSSSFLFSSDTRESTPSQRLLSVSSGRTLPLSISSPTLLSSASSASSALPLSSTSLSSQSRVFARPSSPEPASSPTAVASGDSVTQPPHVLTAAGASASGQVPWRAGAALLTALMIVLAM